MKHSVWPHAAWLRADVLGRIGRPKSTDELKVSRRIHVKTRIIALPVPMPMRIFGRRAPSAVQKDAGVMRLGHEVAGLSGFALIVAVQMLMLWIVLNPA